MPAVQLWSTINIHNSSDVSLPSSPPKRTNTQSARRKLMKRPSINDPRISLVDAYDQHNRAEPRHSSNTSLLVKPPLDITSGNKKGSVKRKRIDNTPAQRVTRPRLSDNATAVKKPAAPTARKTKAGEENSSLETAPLPSGNAPVTASPIPKSYGKQKPAADRLVQTPTPQASPSRTQQIAAEPTAGTRKSRKATGKLKPTLKNSNQQPSPAQVALSSSKPITAVKKEFKAPRQPAGACKSCRIRHQKCDRTHPTCSRCAKMSLSCEYPSTSASGSTVPSKKASIVSQKKKHAALPMKKAADETDRESVLRGRSVTVGPEAPAKRPVPASPSKKPAFNATPTAASSRVPRVKNTQNLKMSPQKKKHE